MTERSELLSIWVGLRLTPELAERAERWRLATAQREGSPLSASAAYRRLIARGLKP